jgi:hypothetical protein
MRGVTENPRRAYSRRCLLLSGQCHNFVVDPSNARNENLGAFSLNADLLAVSQLIGILAVQPHDTAA